MVTIITGATKKPISSEQLKRFFQNNNKYTGYLYIGYPIIGTINGAFPIDALLVSEENGIVVFNLIEGKNTEGYEDAQDDSANKMEAKLKGYKQLMNRRQLLVELNVVTFAPIINNISMNKDYPICNEGNLEKIIDLFIWDSKEYYSYLISILQSISTIRKGKKKREVINPESRGAKLRYIEDSIANLDNRQSRAVIETVDGVQRIRGLAGSGKTIVLALKAAYLHAQHPEWKIAVTFNTRSLKGQFRQLINTFYIEQTNEEPDWDNLQIVHAWGAPGGGDRIGLYYSFCMLHDLEYLDFSTARARFGSGDTFGSACENALVEMKANKQIYDAILVDEAQDFSPSFLRICYELLHDPKRLVYAYDELQNLSKQSLPSPEVIFGSLADGTPKVKFDIIDESKPQQDIILEKCYRNSRPALVTAHALGFGIYRKIDPEIGTGLVQMFEQSNLWNEIGYKVDAGELADGKYVKLQRTTDSSPEFLEKHSTIDDLLVFRQFETVEEQNAWVANEIIKNLREDELRSDDIIVINPNPLTTRSAVAPIRSILFKEGISAHTAGVDTSPDIFFENESIAFTGIYRAKGNEAAMVYIINAQDCFESFGDMARIRNQLFTAITRSKAWVRVLGVGKQMKGLISEYNQVKENQFSLNYVYPTKDQRKYLNIVNRDMSSVDKTRVQKGKSNITSLISDLENGRVFIEDLGSDQIKRLRALLDEQED